MLIGLEVEENPLIYKVEQANDIETVFEDKHLVVINKPVNLLSTPGKHITDSVLTRMQAKYPEATGSLVVHRLDMATSGLMLIAKNEKVFKGLQIQFIQRTIKKRYIAQLDGKLTEKKGIVDLPLTLDFFDRPRQMVCYENGKEALTFWKTIDEREGKTVVHFYPQTGRTHQLRMHAAHSKGLNTPITGDILYGKDADRMYLHAEQIKFEHPITKKHLTVQANADFYDSEKL
ncbi:UNVERIFIED_CONTAM: hypothetical protein GTU68_023217 [Idotea baltica]|nr:hypothetical protein [Idotea baltica]